MPQIAQAVTAITGDSSVRKDVTALLLGYGLLRFCSDLALDGRRPAKDRLSIFQDRAHATGIATVSRALRNDTPTTKRYGLHYSGSSVARPQRLKIDASSRCADVMAEEEVVVANGILLDAIVRLAP